MNLSLFFFLSKCSSRWCGVGGWRGSISRSSLQFHFLQTLEHRTDVSVTSTSPWWEAPEEQGVPGCQLAPVDRAGVPLLSPQVSALHQGGLCL